jgi:uncharacterized membrane protein
MNDNSMPAKEASAFRAVLHAHRSLGPRGFVILMSAIAAVNFAVGVAFYMMGAWPVVGFCGLDILLIYVAFKLNYRSGKAYELVELTPATLKLTQVAPSGKARSFEFNPYWVRVLFSERPDGRTRLCIASHGKELEFGHVLNDDERRDFAGVLENALSNNRGSFNA